MQKCAVQYLMYKTFKLETAVGKCYMAFKRLGFQSAENKWCKRFRRINGGNNYPSSKMQYRLIHYIFILVHFLP